MRLALATDVPALVTYAELLEQELRQAHQRIAELRDENAQLRGEEQTELALDLRALQERLDRREQELFGRSSERRGRKDADGRERPERPTQTGHGPTEQPDLPVQERLHLLDEADRQCPDCGGGLEEMAGCHEESEEVDVVERTLRIVLHRRQKYSCRCGHIEAALGPDKLIPGGRYSADFAVEVAAAKYAEHMPLARQAKRMAGQGLAVTTQTLWDQVRALAAKLEPTWLALATYVRAATVVGADETTWRLMKTGETLKWWVWALRRDDAVVYDLLARRDQEAAATIIGDFHGVLVADGYGAYEALRRTRAGGCRAGPDGKPHTDPCFVLAQCWSHARRRFHKCREHWPEAEEALDLIAQIYVAERQADEADVPDDAARLKLRAKLRDEIARPALDRLWAWTLERNPPPKSGLGKAIFYMTRRWAGLTVFLGRPDVPPDDNATERSIRGPVLGRRNHGGSRSKAGMKASAVLYSLVESAHLAGVEPRAYLREAVRRATNGDPPLLPHDLEPHTG